LGTLKLDVDVREGIIVLLLRVWLDSASTASCLLPNYQTAMISLFFFAAQEDYSLVRTYTWRWWHRLFVPGNLSLFLDNGHTHDRDRWDATSKCLS
jgi:hypothetical protein